MAVLIVYIGGVAFTYALLGGPVYGLIMASVSVILYEMIFRWKKRI